MSIRTIEKITDFENHYQLQSGDNCWIAEKLSTRVIFDTDWEEYQVWLYTDGVRYEDGDYFTDDKDDAIQSALALREGRG